MEQRNYTLRVHLFGRKQVLILTSEHPPMSLVWAGGRLTLSGVGGASSPSVLLNEISYNLFRVHCVEYRTDEASVEASFEYIDRYNLRAGFTATFLSQDRVMATANAAANVLRATASPRDCRCRACQDGESRPRL